MFYLARLFRNLVDEWLYLLLIIKRKFEQDEVAQRPTKAQCEGPTAISSTDVQTGTFENLKQIGERTEAHEGKHAGTKGDASQTRKNFIKALRASISGKAEVDAKRRRCHQAELDLKNSGEDHPKLNRGCEVDANKYDLQSKTIHKGELQAITNIINAGKRR